MGIPSLTINLSMLTSMKVVVILSCLVILSMASLQLQQRVRNRIRNQVTNKKCGDGVDATCVCPDGSQPVPVMMGVPPQLLQGKKSGTKSEIFFRVDLGHWIDSNTPWYYWHGFLYE